MSQKLKIAPIMLLLALFISITPISAAESTHIGGIHDKTVYQGDKFTITTHVYYKGPCGGDRKITSLSGEPLHIYILDSKGDTVVSHNANLNGGKASTKIDTLNFQPGNYTINVDFDGGIRTQDMFLPEKKFSPCSISKKLTILPARIVIHD